MTRLQQHNNWCEEFIKAPLAKESSLCLRQIVMLMRIIEHMYIVKLVILKKQSGKVVRAFKAKFKQVSMHF